MTGKERHHDHRNHDGDQERLVQLYREQGDIEPGPGVDQRIRAKARDEVRPSTLPRPAHWLGGAAVAASLFVVVSIVVNMEPPQPNLPPGDGQAVSDSAPVQPEVDRAEASGFSAEPSRNPVQEVEPPTVMERAAPRLSAPASAPAMERRERQSSADDAARTAREQYEALGTSRSSEGMQEEASELLRHAGKQDMGLLDEESASAQRALWLIERLISVGNAERARSQVEAFRTRYPDREPPKDLIERLEQLETEAGPD